VLSLEAARSAVEVYVGRLALGFNPIAEERAEAESRRAEADRARQAKVEAAQEIAFTVGALIREWATSRGKNDKRSVRYVAAMKATLLTTLAPVLGLPASDLGKKRIEELLVEVEENRGPVAAQRAQVAISMAFAHAIKKERLQINPCAALEPREVDPRERTLAPSEIERIWRGAATLPQPFCSYVQFLMATGVRRNEALHARWSEIEQPDLWHIPAERMKAGRPFTVPLTRAALGALPPRGSGDFIFSLSDGARAFGGATRIKAVLDAAIEADGAGPLAHWVFHDLRRSLATWLGDRAIDYAICDLILAHGIPLDRSGRTYQRSFKINERRAALDKWSELLDPAPVPVRKSRKPALRVVV
jgi:integrase